MTTDNARERFKNAVGILVDEVGGIKQRLMVAYVSQLSQIDHLRELPEPLAATFDAITFTLATEEARGDRGTIAKELDLLSDEEASQIARQIFDIFLELHEIKGSSHDAGTDAS